MLALFLTSTFPVARLIGPFNGTLLAVYQYDPYGNLTSSTGSVANPWRFAAGYFDSSTGLYKFGTRYYNPGFGRWSQQDPVRGNLADPTSLNRYLYVSDDPVNRTDPSGKCVRHDDGWCCITGCLEDYFTIPAVVLIVFAAVCAFVCVITEGAGCVLCILAVAEIAIGALIVCEVLCLKGYAFRGCTS